MTGIAIGLAVLVGASFAHGRSFVVALLVSMLLIALRGRHAMPLVLVLLVALGVGAWRGEEWDRPETPAWIYDADAVVGQVKTVPKFDRERRRFFIEVEEIEIDGTLVRAEGRLFVTTPLSADVQYGDLVRVRGRLSGLEEMSPSFRAYIRSEESGGSVSAFFVQTVEPGNGVRRSFAVARYRLTGILYDAVPGDRGVLLAGLVTGDDRALSPELRRAFLDTSTTHITAVSGSNVALLVGLSTTLGTASGWRRRPLWQVGTVGMVWAYAILVGLEPPSTRAAIMATGAVLASRFGRRPDYLTLLALAAAIMAVADPGHLGTLSFQLSFVSSLAIVLVAPMLTLDGWQSWLRAAAIVTAVAQVATLPVLLAAFGHFSLTSLPANILIAPAVGIAFPLAFLAALSGLVSPLLAAALGTAAGFFAALIFLIVEGLAIDGAIVTVGEPSGIGAKLVPLACFGAVFAVSSEARRWQRDLWALVPAVAERAALVVLGLGLGAGVALVIHFLVR